MALKSLLNRWLLWSSSPPDMKRHPKAWVSPLFDLTRHPDTCTLWNAAWCWLLRRWQHVNVFIVTSCVNRWKEDRDQLALNYQPATRHLFSEKVRSHWVLIWPWGADCWWRCGVKRCLYESITETAAAGSKNSDSWWHLKSSCKQDAWVSLIWTWYLQIHISPP